jgi:acid phosphatase
MKRSALLVAVLALAACAHAPHSPESSRADTSASTPATPATAAAPAAPPAGPPAHDNLNATLWAQRSLEHDLVYRQVWAQAQQQLLKALKDPAWDALPKSERKVDAKKLPPAVIVDIDETVLDNSPYMARIIRNGTGFDDASFEAWCREESARPLPGALEFAQFAAKHGVTMVYISNRDKKLGDVTLSNLRKAGFPVSDKEPVFFGLGADVANCESKGTTKGCRRELVGRTHRVLQLAGDQVSDLIDLDVNTPEGRAATAAPYAGWIGQRWFVLPNPMYGSWDSAVLGNARRGTPEEQRQARRDALRVE